MGRKNDVISLDFLTIMASKVCYGQNSMAICRNGDRLSGMGLLHGSCLFVLGITIKDKNKTKRSIKASLLTYSILCLIGFFGTVFISEDIWYVAPNGIRIRNNDYLYTDAEIQCH